MKRPTMLIAFTLGLGAVLAAVPAPAQTVPEGDASAKASKSKCPKVAFSSVEKPQAMGRKFSAARSADLIFHLQFDGKLDKDHVVTLKVITPNGHLYRRYDIPVASGTKKRSEVSRSLPGYPYPVPVRTPHMMKAGGRNFASVDVSFPVAGSTIVTSSLYGRWNVEVSLDGAADPCGKPTFFHLKE
jgi:hypothetical protein